MKHDVVNFENKVVGSIDLKKDIFEVTPRVDILHRVVNWQRAKSRAGTHKTKGISEISGTTRKPWKQKGTGRARQGSLRSPQFRGGATIFGPVVRSHAYSLQKKVRALGLKMALSSKTKDKKLIILESEKVKDMKTKDLIAKLEKLGVNKPLFVGGKILDMTFLRASRNVKHLDVLPSVGLNVYDILRHDSLVLTQDAVKDIEARLNG